MLKKTIYLAGPYGFSDELLNFGVKSLLRIFDPRFFVINPFTESADLGIEIISIQSQLSEGNIQYPNAMHSLEKINAVIGERNANAIARSDLIFAVLDGADVDSGTAAEIGYGYGLGKVIYGYRGDIRYSGDNLGSKINLQVEYFIKASGGKVYYSFEEIRKDFVARETQ